MNIYQKELEKTFNLKINFSKNDDDFDLIIPKNFDYNKKFNIFGNEVNLLNYLSIYYEKIFKGTSNECMDGTYSYVQTKSDVNSLDIHGNTAYLNFFKHKDSVILTPEQEIFFISHINFSQKNKLDLNFFEEFAKTNSGLTFTKDELAIIFSKLNNYENILSFLVSLNFHNSFCLFDRISENQIERLLYNIEKADCSLEEKKHLYQNFILGFSKYNFNDKDLNNLLLNQLITKDFFIKNFAKDNLFFDRSLIDFIIDKDFFKNNRHGKKNIFELNNLNFLNILNFYNQYFKYDNLQNNEKQNLLNKLFIVLLNNIDILDNNKYKFYQKIEEMGFSILKFIESNDNLLFIKNKEILFNLIDDKSNLANNILLNEIKFNGVLFINFIENYSNITLEQYNNLTEDYKYYLKDINIKKKKTFFSFINLFKTNKKNKIINNNKNLEKEDTIFFDLSFIEQLNLNQINKEILLNLLSSFTSLNQIYDKKTKLDNDNNSLLNYNNDEIQNFKKIAHQSYILLINSSEKNREEIFSLFIDNLNIINNKIKNTLDDYEEKSIDNMKILNATLKK